MNLRPYAPADRTALLEICLRTAHHGEDASRLFRDPWLVGRYFGEAYTEFDPGLCLMLTDTEGPCGYVLGTADTVAFAAWFNRYWLPRLRAEHDHQPVAAGAPDAWLYALLEQDVETPAWVADYPAHLHIDLLPRAQGRGQGRRLVECWLSLVAARGVAGVHLGVSPQNPRATGFYKHLSFQPLPAPPGSVLLGRRLVASELKRSS